MNLIAVTRAQAGKGPRAQSVAGTIGIPGGCGPMKAGSVGLLMAQAG